MSRPSLRLPALVITGFAMLAPAGAQQLSPLPKPDSGGIYVSHRKLARELRAAIAKGRDPALAAIAVTDRYFIHEVHKTEAGGSPGIHHGFTELHYIISGGGTIVTGGRIETSPGHPQGVIVGGKSQRVHKGDAILIPPETPHMYVKIDRELTYLEVRFKTPDDAR